MSKTLFYASLLLPILLRQNAMADVPPVNIADFGKPVPADDATTYGIMWEDPREIHRLTVVFAEDAPARSDLSLQYWQSSWPERRIPRDESSGAGESGWLDVGDWHKGKWVTAAANVQVSGPEAVFTFRSIKEEFPELKDFDADYRTTFKLRVVGRERLPKVLNFHPETDTKWLPIEVDIIWGGKLAGGVDDATGGFEAFNGAIESSVAIPDKSGFRLRAQYAEPAHYNSFDETVLTIRARGVDTFSFAPKDLLKSKRIILPDLGVLIRLAGDATTYEQALAETKSGVKDIYSRVLDVPEQTFPNVWRDMPQKQRQYIPLSFEGGRQHFRLDSNGGIACNSNYIRRLHGKDTDRCLWDGDEICYSFGFLGEQCVNRDLADGCLPIVTTTWERDGVRYTQTAFVTPLDGVPEPGGRILADDTLVAMLRFRMQLVEGAQQRAQLSFSVNGTPLFVDGDAIIDALEKMPPRLRMLVRGIKTAQTGLELNPAKEVIHAVELTAAQPESSVDVVIPFITFTAPAKGEEWGRLRALDFDKALADVTRWWRGRVDESARIVTPEPMINDFYKAHVSHLLINTEREVGGALRYMAKVGTFHYGVYANESCMMVSDLDRRGFHKRAEEALETWLHYQGSRALPGAYSTKDGIFYGAGGYEDNNGYNQHHGWVLWCMGEHYWYTRDNEWLNHAAPNIVKACDWIANERRATIEPAAKSPMLAVEKGLLPHGSLEDIGDWRTWLSNNVFSWWGMDNAARALAAANHPDGARLVEEADAYKQDLTDAVGEAMRRAPVVRLRDGSWIPDIPSDLHRRGRSFGWITETLEGSIHLVRCGVLEPRDRTSTWIIKDFEDNRYISEQYGYNLTGDDFDRYWFSRGGISQQANLLCNPIPYLQRDEPEHFLRAYFNAFAASYFADTRMMTEHALPNLGDWRGDHYKSSDEANSTYWLRLMFIEERGDELWVGAAIPRYWLAAGNHIGVTKVATYYGPMSVTYDAGPDSITASIDPPRRNPPRTMFVRFRHPDKAKIGRCEINGEPAQFDAEKEWVEVKNLTGPLKITAFYK